MTTKIAFALALAIHRLGQRSYVCQPASWVAGGRQLPGGLGIRPNLGLGLRLNDESEHLPWHISTENDHEDACHKISGCTRIGSRARAERRDLIVCTTPRPELYTAIRQFGRADGSLLLNIQLQGQMTRKEPGDRALFFCVCDVPVTVDQDMIYLTAPSPGPRCGRGAK